MMLTAGEYALLVEQSPIMIWRAGTDKLCDYFNERWLDYTGRKMEQEVGNGWAEGVHPEDFDRCLAIYVSGFDERRVFEMEYRLRRSDGEYRWILDRGVPFYAAGGEFLGYIGSCIDVHEARLARIAMEEMRQKEIARLQKMLPVCAWCKKVRTDDGYWKELEEYFRSQNPGRISHGICEACASSSEFEKYRG